MIHSQNATVNKSRQIKFDIQLGWLSEQKGILTANDVKGAIQVATPPAFGGEGYNWSPEHLFLGAVAGCFLSTCLVFVKKADFEMSHFECNATGNIELVEGKYKFTSIDVFTKLYVAGEELTGKAKMALSKAEQYCLVSNSIDAQITYHSEALTDLHPRRLFQ